MMRAFSISLASLVFLTAFAAEAGRARSSTLGLWHVRAVSKTTVGVVAFSDDGTRALLQEKQSARGQSAANGVAVLTRYVVVNGTSTLHEAVISNALHIPGNAMPAEGIDNPTCRERAAALEKVLADFSDVRVRASACAKPARADQLIELEASTPAPLTSTEALRALQEELEIGPGLVFVNERGPLVVVVRASFDDPFGKSNEALTFLRSDPRIRDRWPAPR